MEKDWRKDEDGAEKQQDTDSGVGDQEEGEVGVQAQREAGTMLTR